MIVLIFVFIFYIVIDWFIIQLIRNIAIKIQSVLSPTSELWRSDHVNKQSIDTSAAASETSTTFPTQKNFEDFIPLNRQPQKLSTTTTYNPLNTVIMGRVRTKTVKKSAKVIIERYYPKLTLDFETNKRICDEIAIIASKRLRNKVNENLQLNGMENSTEV